MKRILPILLSLLLTCGAGYKGTLPDLASEFDYKRTQPTTATPNFSETKNPVLDELKPVPRDNKKYIDIIIKKNKSSKYENDTIEVIKIIERLKQCIEKSNDIQMFNATISNLIDHVAYIKDTYENQQESTFTSYKTLLKLSSQARNVAVLRTESQIYTKYLPYQSDGSVYSKHNIDIQTKSLLKSINQTLYVLKNLD